MGIVAKLGGMAGKAIARAYVGKGKKLYQKVGRKAGEMIGKSAARAIPIIGSFKKGGRVKKTGAYILHKGERVIPSGKCSCSHKNK
jgi:hypothetical protein